MFFSGRFWPSRSEGLLHSGKGMIPALPEIRTVPGSDSSRRASRYNNGWATGLAR